MVTWQKLVEIAFDVADDKGAQFEGISDGGQFMSQVAELWSQNKETWKQYTEAQARRELEEVVTA